jgi:hypothetical protein
MKALRWFLPVVLLALLFPAPAAASLTTFATFVGNDRGSTDGCRSASQPCLLGPGGPAGSSVLGGYLYSIFSGSFNQGGSIGTPVDYTRGAYRRGDFSSLLTPILDGNGPFNFTITQRADSDGNGVSSNYHGPATSGFGGGGGGGGGGLSGFSTGGFSASGLGDIANDGPSITELKVGDGYSADGSGDGPPIDSGYWNGEPDGIVPSVKAGDANLVVPGTGDTLLTSLAADPPGLAAADPDPTTAPEPATLSLVLLGGAGIVRAMRRRRASA